MSKKKLWQYNDNSKHEEVVKLPKPSTEVKLPLEYWADKFNEKSPPHIQYFVK